MAAFNSQLGAGEHGAILGRFTSLFRSDRKAAQNSCHCFVRLPGMIVFSDRVTLARALGPAQVGMVATATDAEGLAGFGEVHARLLVVEGLDEGVSLASCWATMAKAF